MGSAKPVNKDAVAKPKTDAVTKPKTAATKATNQVEHAAKLKALQEILKMQTNEDMAKELDELQNEVTMDDVVYE